MNISLPIPEIKLITKHFIWVPLDTNKRCSVHKFTIKGHESIKNLRNYILEEILSKQGLCDNENGFEIVQILQDRVQRMMSHPNLAIGLQTSSLHLFVYEIDRNAMPAEVLSTHEEIGAQNNSQEQQYDGSEPNLPLKDEIARRVSPNYLMTVLNIEIIDYWAKPTRTQPDESVAMDKETYFPRLTFLNLDDTLINIHLKIFDQLKFLFTRFLEMRDWYQHNNIGGHLKNNVASSSIEDSLFLQKMSMKIPLHLTLDKWRRMKLNQQYEIVFSS